MAAPRNNSLCLSGKLPRAPEHKTLNLLLVKIHHVQRDSKLIGYTIRINVDVKVSDEIRIAIVKMRLGTEMLLKIRSFLRSF